jgi:hypothetical protein
MPEIIAAGFTLIELAHAALAILLASAIAASAKRERRPTWCRFLLHLGSARVPKETRFLIEFKPSPVVLVEATCDRSIVREC